MVICSDRPSVCVQDDFKRLHKDFKVNLSAFYNHRSKCRSSECMLINLNRDDQNSVSPLSLILRALRRVHISSRPCRE